MLIHMGPAAVDDPIHPIRCARVVATFPSVRPARRDRSIDSMARLLISLTPFWLRAVHE